MPTLDELIETGENPIRVIRIRNGLSLRKAAGKIGCHYQALYMLEHGMYLTVLSAILYWAVSVSDFTELQIREAYSLFRSGKQVLAQEKYSLSVIGIDSLGMPGDNPVLKFREYLGLTQSAFCKQLCLPVALLYMAEKKSASLPPSLRCVFEDLNIPGTVIQEMVERYKIVEGR